MALNVVSLLQLTVCISCGIALYRSPCFEIYRPGMDNKSVFLDQPGYARYQQIVPQYLTKLPLLKLWSHIDQIIDKVNSTVCVHFGSVHFYIK